MFGLGTTELVVILIIALIIFGAGKLSSIGTGLGEAIKNFKKALNTDNDATIHPQKEKMESTSLKAEESDKKG